MWLSSAMTLKKNGVGRTASFLDNIEVVFTPEVHLALRIVIWIFYNVIVFHCDSFASQGVSHLTQNISHDLFILLCMSHC